MRSQIANSKSTARNSCNYKLISDIFLVAISVVTASFVHLMVYLFSSSNIRRPIKAYL
jgi:hypothetical protein